MKAAALPARTYAVSVGICAFNEERRIGAALESLVGQSAMDGFAVTEILIIASGCTDGTADVVSSWARTDPRIRLVAQPVREGKASAINAFLSRARGQILVLLNADARLPPNSLRALLEPFSHDPGLQISCGLPMLGADGSPMVRRYAEALWGLHNRALATLDRLGLPNHCCDEFLAMRRGFVDSIPPKVINDGAYLSLIAEQRGQSVRICDRAVVTVEIPSSLRGALRQRRRVLRGHRQVQRLMERSTNTLESMFLRNPRAVVETLRREFAHNPRGILEFLLLLLPIESTAVALAALDEVRSVAYAPAWTVVE